MYSWSLWPTDYNTNQASHSLCLEFSNHRVEVIKFLTDVIKDHGCWNHYTIAGREYQVVHFFLSLRKEWKRNWSNQYNQAIFGLCRCWVGLWQIFIIRFYRSHNPVYIVRKHFFGKKIKLNIMGGLWMMDSEGGREKEKMTVGIEIVVKNGLA